ncbi:MAG: hypothetical protein ACP5R0_03905 [Thermoplasmata archaeon]
MNDPKCRDTVEVDRNIKNVTVGIEKHIEIYDLSEVLKIKEKYRKKVSHFKRNDRRISRKIESKYRKRSKTRTKQICHKVGKEIVNNAKNKSEAILVENIKSIRKITKKGDYNK